VYDYRVDSDHTRSRPVLVTGGDGDDEDIFINIYTRLSCTAPPYVGARATRPVLGLFQRRGMTLEQISVLYMYNRVDFS